MKTFTIGTNDANQRFDKYLKKLLPNASVSFLYKMLRKKNITLDGKKATGKETLQKGAQVAVFFSDETLHKFMQDTKKLQEEFHMLQRLPMKGVNDSFVIIADILRRTKSCCTLFEQERRIRHNPYNRAVTLKTFSYICNRYACGN